jgi:hypothetical protein
MKTKINIIYRTEKGTEYPSYEEAIIADAIEKIPDLYMEGYRIKEITKALVNQFTFSERAITLIEEERIPNETV